MTRLEGKKPNTGAIILGAITFSLVAAGLFFAFRPVADPTDVGASNSADITTPDAMANTADSKATNDESTNSLATILTPLPLATPTATPTIAPTPLTTNATTPAENSVVAPDSATTPVATPGVATATSAPEMPVTNATPISP